MYLVGVALLVAVFLFGCVLLLFALWLLWTLLRLPVQAWQDYAQRQARNRLANGLTALMDVADNDLLDLLLRRKDLLEAAGFTEAPKTWEELVAQAVAGQAERFDVFSRLRHRKFPGGPLLRTPSLVIGMAYHQLMDLI